MVKSNSYKIINSSKITKNLSFLNLVYRPILNNKSLNVHDRSFAYGYSRNFYRGFKTKQKAGCLFSGRNRGVLAYFYLSRMTFKKFAMTGILTGFKKSRW